MKIRVSENGYLIIEEFYNPIILKHGAEEIWISCRNDGFEFVHQQENYIVEDGGIQHKNKKRKNNQQ